MIAIDEVTAREVLDSRANPTIEVEVLLADGARGRALVPSGASTGAGEAVELRDGDTHRFLGRGVLKAVDNVRRLIGPAIIGMPVDEQEKIDAALVALDGSPDKANLGANAILGVSMAVARAAARSRGRPLYEILGSGVPPVLPVPMLNIVNGGKHAEDSTDFQEFMVIPAGFDSFGAALRAGVEVYHALKALLRKRGLSTGVGDEGGFAPSLPSNRDAVELVLEAIQLAGYAPGKQCFIGLDVAATELLADDGRYTLAREQKRLSARELAGLYEQWVRDYPLISIEDGMAEEDWDGWQAMTAKLGDTTQLVGDDLYTTNTERIRLGVERKASNAVLIKPNQIGTVSETLAAIRMAQDSGWGTIISHRSGETEDTTIVDLAVGTSAGQIKSGAPARGERTAKYNRLLRIEEELGNRATFAGLAAYGFIGR